MGKKTGKVYVVGHKNPDTDSICSGYRVRGIKEEDYRGGVYGKAGGPHQRGDPLRA